jgi:hypothetical protein
VNLNRTFRFVPEIAYLFPLSPILAHVFRNVR